MRNRAWVLLALFGFGCGDSSSGDGSGGGGVAGSTGGAAGASGGSAGATGGSAGTGGTAGAGGECTTIRDQYAAAVDKAKACSVGSTNACTQSIDISIEGCGVYLYGDASNTTALAELDSLQKQFVALSCDWSGSCALGGKPPMTAQCKPAGQGGTNGICSE